jgi:nucleotide-binding universal stress UspA family protein
MIKTILVPATGSDTDAAVFSSALTAARAFGAHLDFLHVRIDAVATAAAMASEGSSAPLVSGLIDRMEEEADQREQKAKQLFEGFCQRERLVFADTPPSLSAPSAQWFRQIGPEPYWLAEYGRAADLLVVGRPGDGDGVSLDMLEAALLDSGRPLLIPPAASMAGLPETVAIAWKATPEAARAVTAAMPFLSMAKQIVVLTVAEDETTTEEEGTARLVTNFRWHGVPVASRRLQPDAHGAAETLLAAAGEHAGLLVMGGYGHSRLREWIFGGFTQRVLRDAEIPVLMAH